MYVNVIQCLAPFAYAFSVPLGISNKYTVDTSAGNMELKLLTAADIKVDMGPRITFPSETIHATLTVPTDTIRNVVDRY